MSPSSLGRSRRSHRAGGLLITSLLVFCIALIALLLLRNSVREIFVIPLLYLFWLGGLIFRSIHQLVFWGVSVLLVALFLFRSLPRRPRPRLVVGQTRREGERSRRVAHWAGEIRRNANRTFRDTYSLREFRKLIVSVWAYQTNLSPQEVERDIRGGRLQWLPELQLYFQSSDQTPPPGTSIFQRVLQRVKLLLKVDNSKRISSFDQHLYPMIQFLETQLEVTREHRDHSSR